MERILRSSQFLFRNEPSNPILKPVHHFRSIQSQHLLMPKPSVACPLVLLSIIARQQLACWWTFLLETEACREYACSVKAPFTITHSITCYERTSRILFQHDSHFRRQQKSFHTSSSSVKKIQQGCPLAPLLLLLVVSCFLSYYSRW